MATRKKKELCLLRSKVQDIDDKVQATINTLTESTQKQSRLEHKLFREELGAVCSCNAQLSEQSRMIERCNGDKVRSSQEKLARADQEIQALKQSESGVHPGRDRC